MINVVYFKDRSGHLTGYEISGHSGYADHGQGIICAAVSVLGINTANALESLAGIKISAKSKDGYLKVELPEQLSDVQRHDADLLLRSLETGLVSIRSSYGSQYLQFSTFE